MKSAGIKHSGSEYETRLQRFWSKVKVLGPDDCWEWTAGTRTGGYGNMLWLNGKYRGAHQISYELANGAPPKGLVLDHVCRNPLCVNPRHLRPCTKSQNAMYCKLYANNSTGYKGVTFDKKKYVARINYNGKTTRLGCFTTAEEAYNVFCEAAKNLHGEFANPGSCHAGKPVLERTGSGTETNRLGD